MTIVHVDECHAAVLKHIIECSALFGCYTLEILEELEMLTANVRDKRMCWLCDFAQPGDLAGVVCADLEYSHVMTVSELEQHLWKADLIVVIRFGLQHAARCAEHVREQFFRCGLAVRSCYDEDGDLELAAVEIRQIAMRLQ